MWTWSRDRRMPPPAALVTLIFAVAALADEEQLTRTWGVSLPAGIEWAQVVGRGDAVALLVATRDARVHVLDPASGQELLAEPVQAGRGVRPAAGPEHAAPADVPSDLACCFDRHAVYALRLSRPAALQWQHGHASAKDDFPGDPEALTGRVGVALTAAGVLIANTSGEVALLSYADGSERWRIDLGPLPTARLHATASTAVVVWKADDRVQAAFLDLAAPRPQPRVRDLGRHWPIWSGLVADELLTVSPAQVTLWPPTGPPRSFDIDTFGLRAAAIDAFVPPDDRGERPAGSAPVSTRPAAHPLLLLGAGPAPSAYDLVSDQKVWPKSGARGSGFDVETLTIRGERFVLTNELGVGVGDLDTGRTELSSLKLPPARLASWDLTTRCLYTLSGDAEDPNAPFQLERVAPPSQPASRPDGAAPATTTFSLPAGGTLRQVLWPPGALVLVEKNGLRAFRLP